MDRRGTDDAAMPEDRHEGRDEDRLVTLVVGSTAAAAGLADRAASSGGRVGRVDPCTAVGPAAAIDRVVAEIGPPTCVVVAHVDPAAAQAGPLVALDDEGWDSAGERSIRTVLQVLQAVRPHLCAGSSVVVVLPSVATIGVPGLVPMCTAVEAIRVMAKVVARRWGSHGVTVNVVLVPLDAYLGDQAPDGLAVPSLGAASLPDRDPLDDAASLVDVVSGPQGRALTGATLAADAGTVMVP